MAARKKHTTGSTAKRRTKKTVRRILNVVPSRDTERDWQIEQAEMQGAVRAPRRLPSSMDLRETWWKIGDQESTGSCVGWATADSVLRWHFVRAGRIGQTDILSPRFIWMAAKETDEFNNRPTTFIEMDGTSLKAALDVARGYGAVLDADLPFRSGQLFQGEARDFYAKAARLRIASYFNLRDNPSDWRKWLATEGPILTVLDVDDTFMDAGPRSATLKRYKKPSMPAGHAIAMVGYTRDHFIVRNSWGTGWGDKGFAYATNAYAKPAFREAYGVTV